MKKIFLLLFAAVCAAASWAQSTVSATVKGQELEVALANDAQAFVAFQMDITLPAGVTGVSDIVMNTDRLTEKDGNPVPGATDANFILVYNQIDATHVRVLAYNLENRALAGTSGELFTVQFEGTPTSDFTIDNSLFVTTTNLEEIKLALATSTEAAYVPGDVTGDGFVTAADIVAVVNIINGTDDPSFHYNYEAANCSGDAIISAADIVAIVNLINQ